MASTASQPALDVAGHVQLSTPLSRRQRWLELGLVILFAIAPLTLSATDALCHPAARTSLSSGFGLVRALLHPISSLLLAFYFLARRGVGLRAIGFAWRWLDGLKGLGLAFAALFLSAIMHVLVRSVSLSVTGQPPDMRDPRLIFGGVSSGMMAIYSFSAAIFEETIVRAFVTTELIALAWPVWLATISSIVLQTSYHLYYGVGGALGVSGVFIVFGIYFARSRRLLPVILGHLFVDLWAVWVNHFR